MKKLIFFAFPFLFFCNSYTQIEFEAGYFIDNQNQKVNCLIKNNDWKLNPDQFKYKLAIGSKVETQTADSIKEFTIAQKSRFRKFTVDVDRSPESFHNMETSREPDFKQETLLLKTLVEGKFSLYYYEEEGLKRFFVQKGSDKAIQLVYKKYLPDGDRMKINRHYRIQLQELLKCPAISFADFETLQYTKRDLIALFTKYFENTNPEYIIWEKIKRRDAFNLVIRPGINFAGLWINNSLTNSHDVEFGRKPGFRIGCELEYILPYNKNKWGIFTEATLQFFRAKKQISTGQARAKYQSLEIPLGVRYYSFLKNQSRLFLDFAYAIDMQLSSEIIFEPGTNLKIESRNNLYFGIGYSFIKEKAQVQLRYATNRHLLGGYYYWKSAYSNVSLIFGYNLL